MNTRNKWDLLYHLVFGTKSKAAFLTPEVITDLQLLFAIKVKELRGDILACGGHEDHVHLLVSMPPRVSVSELVKNLKGYSSFMRPDIIWQRGFGAFTVDRRSVDAIIKYIQNQENHHGRK
ncbi:IS200/IS605 family transposase [Turneriella parva]|uniref:Transposase IS200-family protein n=1 Tax=Turneriella parva (strain ATCC BAA-1111 / DSM 21527 / NCTC 11395 / H) TaxID=869212 RepID=I4BBR7_TURPD|nr:IS200/IS605 family transposase [Turneriella parva]AFM14724.1 transposase IS200-family protein [Turneriella parva DSM 21527]